MKLLLYMTIPQQINNSQSIRQLEDTLDKCGDEADQYRELVYEKMRILLGQTSNNDL